jgi:predicted dehydrogenase
MSSQFSRREFVKTSLATGAAALASSVHVAAAQDAATAAAPRPVTIGVMGLSRGLSVATTFGKQAGVKIKYVCDVDQERASTAANAVNSSLMQSAEAIGDFRRILDDKEVDALVAAPPNHRHAPAAIMALNAGKHVYVEKPCSHNPWEGELLVQAARKANKAVQMGTQRRSSPSYQEAVKLLHEGIIGRVYLARSWYNNLRPAVGLAQASEPPANLDWDLWQGPAPRRPYHNYMVDGMPTSHYNWHWFWHYGNGELGNNGVHALDICRWGMGVEYPVRVTSSGGRYRWDDDQETPDTHTVAYEFDGKRQITWEGLSCNKHSIDAGFVSWYGEEGTLAIDGKGSFKVYDRTDKVIQEHAGKTDDGDHVANFLAAIRNDKPLELNAEILKGHQSTLMCHLGNIAHRTGRALTCDGSNGHIVGDDEAMKLWKREYEPGWEPTIS